MCLVLNFSQVIRGTSLRRCWSLPEVVRTVCSQPYISRRGDTVGPPVWKSTILHIFSKSELSILEAMAVRAPMTYVAPSTLSHANSYRVSDHAISHPVPLRRRA